MSANPIHELGKLGQSVWLDYIRRELLQSGKLKKMIDEDGIKGMTSNPAIFEKAIVDTADYNEEIQALSRAGKSVMDIYESLSQSDVKAAADLFRGVYDSSEALDGYVSLEVNPHLARNSEQTLEEARRLWKALDRPNVCIKVPATVEGIPVIRQLISDGINVNVTLIFGLERYQAVAEAYIKGLEDRAAIGASLKNICSVASFFVSRIDVMVDALLEKLGSPSAKALQGEIAVACAKGALDIYKELFESPRFKALEAKGARSQRLLWASTATKNPAYSDVKYVEALIGADTVDTVPMETLDAYREHGKPALRLGQELEKARQQLTQLNVLGISLRKVSQDLEDDGVTKFNQPFDKIMASLERAAAPAA